MLDINLLRKQLDDVVARLATRPFEFPVKEFNALENDRKAVQKQTEELQALRNSLSKQIGAAQTSVVPLLAAGIFYYVFNLIVATVMEYIEKRLSYYR